ncbi:hypothetical protein ACQY0O_001928 [Thecaphora frezii]
MPPRSPTAASAALADTLWRRPSRSFPTALLGQAHPLAYPEHALRSCPHRNHSTGRSESSSGNNGNSGKNDNGDLTQLSGGIKALMRSSAQPVALITCFLPHASPPSSTRLVHGATLSSFSSISMSPPMVGFSIKTPSRLADALVAGAAAAAPRRAHFVLNVLAAHQAELAAAFATPGIQPLPYLYPPKLEHAVADELDGAEAANPGLPVAAMAEPHPLQSHPVLPCHEADGVPVVDGAVGALACSLVSSIPLAQFVQPPQIHPASQGQSQSDGDGENESVLFLARVHAVVDTVSDRQLGSPRSPLVYYDRRFTTVR